MYILTNKYKYEVFQRLLTARETFEVACSKSGLSKQEAKKLLTKDSF
ncbi:hypothetical protein ACMC56_07635 [Campylobacterota bacterium DY0563]|nr:hypothetical protein [Halarcobacter sp.]